MKREEKNQQTKRRILDGALSEFSQQGYGAGSINAICSAQGISKGIIYHYFSSKDDLFLACVDECFRRLTAYLDRSMQTVTGNVEQQLEGYFAARLSFFTEHPVYQRIFCEAVLTPPAHLREEVQKCKKSFDALNLQILERILDPIQLRPQITREEVVETFQEFQDYINAQYQTIAFEAHEKRCRRVMQVLLYGVIDRREQV
ncbi:MAG: TetR/AcrR family transcriptional regulator [Oscillospiraceae bacterium]